MKRNLPLNQNRRAFLRNTAAIGGAITLQNFAGKADAASFGTGYLLADPEHEGVANSSVRQLFQSPPKKYRPLVRWWWPGQ